MRIHIWQQFTSNHSANYTIVGLFDSIEKARETSDYLRELLVDILESNTQDRRMDLPWQLNPVEERVAREHGFDWQEPIDRLRAFYAYRRAFIPLSHRAP